MLSNLMRLGALAGSAMILTVAFAWAQEREPLATAAARGVEVFNPVQGRIAVVSSVPDGARVEKGDIVCELDASELQDRLASLELVIRGAEADAQAARLAREVAAMNVVEYEKARFVSELAASQGELALAQSSLARAEDHLDWSRKMFDKGYVSHTEKVADELALKRARFDLELAEVKRQILINYTRSKTSKTLLGDVETARARELAKQAVLERERSAQRRLAGQLSRCKVAAPARGRVAYAAPMGAGAVVRDGQLICVITPEGTPAKSK